MELCEIEENRSRTALDSAGLHRGYSLGNAKGRRSVWFAIDAPPEHPTVLHPVRLPVCAKLRGIIRDLLLPEPLHESAMEKLSAFRAGRD